MLVSLIGRVIVVTVACLLAALVGGGLLVMLGLERITELLHARDDDRLFAVFELVLRARPLAAGFTLLPALLLVIVGEVGRIRSALYYIVGGGVALCAVPLIGRLGGSEGQPTAALWQLFATAGFAAGLVYWLLAGRRA
jgi:hypothetical protein